MGERKRIGILTSGGDCAGLNAWRLVYRAIGTYGWEVLGIRQATLGLTRPLKSCPWKSKG